LNEVAGKKKEIPILISFYLVQKKKNEKKREKKNHQIDFARSGISRRLGD